MRITELLALAKRGSLEACSGCPWSPQVEPSVGFGASCTEHGVNWTTASDAVSMLIVQDPADTTPHQSGRLCAVHNAANPSDKTAQQNLLLWNATVSLQTDSPDAGGYLKKHYWTNSIMHGASGNTGLREKPIMSQARAHCSKVLEAQIRALRPRVIIATGMEAVNSLNEIGLISGNWSAIRYQLREGAYHQQTPNWLGEHPIDVYGTYHTAARVVNQTLSRMYHSVETEALIREKTRAIGEPQSVLEFLVKYNRHERNATDRGMRFLLNHWLDIGAGIRRAHQDAI